MKLALSISTALLAAAFLPTGCGRPPAGPSVSGTPALHVPRSWRATFAESDGTELVVRMSVLFPAPARWDAYSRPGAAREMIPWYQSLFGGLLGKLPPHAALIALDSGTARASGDSIILRGMLSSPFLGHRAFLGSMHGAHIRADLRRGSDTGAVAGMFDASPEPSALPVRDYPEIGRNVRKAITDLVYDAALPKTASYQRFFTRLDAAFARARDDLDVVSAFYSLRSDLRTTHFNFVRNPKIAATPLDSIMAGDPSVDPAKLVRLQFTAPGLAYLYVSKWDRVGPAIDGAFVRIDSAKARVLILDIRGNPGGDATSLVPATHLLSETTPVGVFVGRKWYNTHQRPPTTADLAAFPVISSDAEAKQLLSFVRDSGGAVGRVPPRAPHFAGTVYLLVDHSTASASEPLTYLLKRTRRATIIGERTAGAMLTALPHPVGEGFIVTVPEADYYAADGTRLEGRGVEPDVVASSPDALIAVGELVRTILPYAGAVWLAGAFTNRGRWDEAESAWRDALALAPSAEALTSIEARIAAIQKARAEHSPR